MVRTTMRRGNRVLVIDFSFTKPDGFKGRYRRDAEVQTKAAAYAEERRRLAAVATMGSPFAVIDPAAHAQVTPEPPLAPAEPTFAEVAERYLKEFAPSHLKGSTRVNYANALKARLVPRFGAMPLTAIDAKAIRELDVAMVADGIKVGTRRYVLCVLRSVLCKFAIEAGLLRETPKLPKLPKKGDTIPHGMSPEHFERILAASQPAHRLAFLLSGHAGLRRGEIRALRCGDVDLERGRLVVRLATYRRATDTPKSGSEREVPLTPALRDALAAAAVDRRPRGELACLTVQGKPWGESSLNAAFARAVKRAGVEHWRLHDLRHYFVTALLNTGVSAHVVRELAGHEDLATTQRYAHVQGKDRLAAIQALGATYKNDNAEGASPAA